MARYYIGYGSNLDVEQMAYRCKDAVKVGTTYLKGYRLAFKHHGGSGSYATIERSKSDEDVVPVGIWEISAKDELRLDCYEGVDGGFYYKKEIPFTINGKKEKGLVYIMNKKARYDLPSSRYILTIMNGYADFGISLNYLYEGLAYSEYRQNR